MRDRWDLIFFHLTFKYLVTSTVCHEGHSEKINKKY